MQAEDDPELAAAIAASLQDEQDPSREASQAAAPITRIAGAPAQPPAASISHSTSQGGSGSRPQAAAPHSNGTTSAETRSASEQRLHLFCSCRLSAADGAGKA